MEQELYARVWRLDKLDVLNAPQRYEDPKAATSTIAFVGPDAYVVHIALEGSTLPVAILSTPPLDAVFAIRPQPHCAPTSCSMRQALRAPRTPSFLTRGVVRLAAPIGRYGTPPPGYLRSETLWSRKFTPGFGALTALVATQVALDGMLSTIFDASCICRVNGALIECTPQLH